MESDYLTEILSTADGTVPDIDSETKNLKKQINLLKSCIIETIDEGKVNLEHLLNDITKLTIETDYVATNMLKLDEEINSAIRHELSNSIKELDQLSITLQEINLSMTFLVQMADIQSSLKKANENLQNKEFHECAKTIKSLQTLTEKNSLGMEHVSLYNSLTVEGYNLHKELLVDLNSTWLSNVRLTTEIVRDIKLSRLRINVDNISQITDVLRAAESLNITDIEQEFSQKFFDTVIKQIIMFRASVRELPTGNKDLHVEIMQNNRNPTSKEIFVNLRKVLDFLKKCLDVEITEGCSFMNRIGSLIGKDIITTVIDEYLLKIIPTTAMDLKNYYEIMKQAEEFENYLKDSGLLQQSCIKMLTHKNNVNDLFITKYVAAHLERGRIIMKKDLGNVVYGDDFVITELHKFPESCSTILKNEFNIKESTYVYSKIQISKSAKDLTDFVREIMFDAIKSRECFTVKIYEIVLNLFEAYAAIVPLHHRRFLETVPAQTGLLHNNYLYFSYYLINLISELYERIPPILHDHLYKIFETAAFMRKMSKDTFDRSLTAQKYNFIQMVQNSGLAAARDDPELQPDVETTIRQITRQLQLLEDSWKCLLPPKTYDYAMGSLIDICMDELMNIIMEIEDIPSLLAADLVTTLRVVMDRVPRLFWDRNEVFKYCEKWLKLQEFVFILGATLREIEDRWAQGMGPLASVFTPEQVKGLIRCLFQNSERRANCLNRIK